MSRVETPTATDPNSQQSFTGASRMAGSDDTGSESPSGPTGQSGETADPQQALQSAVQVIRQAEQSIVELSKAFPQASKEVRAAREAIRSVLKKIVSNPGGSEPVAPRTGL